MTQNNRSETDVRSLLTRDTFLALLATKEKPAPIHSEQLSELMHALCQNASNREEQPSR